jgi:hypothetical protein
MINEVDGEELIEDFEIPTALHLLSIPANDRLRGIGTSDTSRCTGHTDYFSVCSAHIEFF